MSSKETVILSVDDDAVNQTVIEILLEGSGYRVIQAMDGIEALEILEKRDRLPDLALVDVMMPRMSGYELCRKLRELYAPYFPIVMISAKSSKEDIIQGLECQCNDYVTKPFDKEELLARIEALLRLNEMRLQQESVEFTKVAQQMSLPQQVLSLPSNGEPFETVAVAIMVSDSMKPFIEFLAKKFSLVPIPNRIGGVFLALLPEPRGGELAPFIEAVIEHGDDTQSVTCCIAKGICRATIFSGDSVLPSIVLYGPVMESVTRLMGMRSTFRLSGAVVMVSNEDLEFPNLFVVDRNTHCVIFSTENEPKQVLELEDHIPVRPVGVPPQDSELDSLSQMRNSLSDGMAFMIDLDELESTVRRLSDQNRSLESEYREKCMSVNEKLKLVLQQESLNELLFLEIKRRQFDQSPFR